MKPFSHHKHMVFVDMWTFCVSKILLIRGGDGAGPRVCVNDIIIGTLSLEL